MMRAKSSRINSLESEIREETARMERAPADLDSKLLNGIIRRRTDLLEELFRESADRGRLQDFLREIRSRDAITMARLNIRYSEVKSQLNEMNVNGKISAAYRASRAG